MNLPLRGYGEYAKGRYPHLASIRTNFLSRQLEIPPNRYAWPRALHREVRPEESMISGSVQVNAGGQMAIANNCQLLVIKGTWGKTSFYHWDSKSGVLQMVSPRKPKKAS